MVPRVRRAQPGEAAARREGGRSRCSGRATWVSSAPARSRTTRPRGGRGGAAAAGRTAGAGGNGGDGGSGQGGAVRALLGSINISEGLLAGNAAVGGAGGAAGDGGVGGSGGNGQGGGFLTAVGVTAVLSDSALLGNLADG